MAYSQPLTYEQLLLERMADRLLESNPADPKHPAYSERVLAGRGRGIVMRINRLAEQVVAEPQEFRDELRFLMSVTRLSGEVRRCLRLWVDGWSQWEIARGFGVTQQTVSRRLRIGLRSCYDSAILSFRKFSHHTVYRRPTRTRNPRMERVCSHCEDGYLLAFGSGRYCSQRCRETALHIRAQKSRASIDSPSETY